MPAMPLPSSPRPRARNRRVTIPATLFGTSTVMGAIGSSCLTSATAARRASRAGRPYAVVVTWTVTPHPLRTPPGLPDRRLSARTDKGLLDIEQNALYQRRSEAD